MTKCNHLGRFVCMAGGLLAACIIGTLGACSTHNNTIIGAPHYNVDHALPLGEWGLRKLSPSEYPNMEAAFMNKQGLIKAIDRSLKFIRSPSSEKFFPDGPITHQQMLNSLLDFRYMVQTVSSSQQFQQMIVQRYDVYTAKGYDNKGSVWFTGYYTPILKGSLTETSEFRYPVYKRPADLVSNPITGAVLGQKLPNGQLQKYPTRRQLMQGHLLQGDELVWFRSELDAYIAEVQGSAKVQLPSGEEITIGYAGDNGRTYSGLGEALVNAGKIRRRQLSLPAIISYAKQHPNTVHQYILDNNFMAFLKVYNPAHWPLGSLGVKVTAHRSLATDKHITAPPYQSIFPRAAVTFVSTIAPNTSGAIGPFQQFMLDQDTGGAIRAAGRADIYMGIGPVAAVQADYELNKGRLYYLFLKPGLTPMGQSGAYTESLGNAGAPAPKGAANPSASQGSVGGGQNVPANSQMFPGAK